MSTTRGVQTVCNFAVFVRVTGVKCKQGTTDWSTLRHVHFVHYLREYWPMLIDVYHTYVELPTKCILIKQLGRFQMNKRQQKINFTPIAEKCVDWKCLEESIMI